MPAMTNILVKDDTVTTPLEFILQPVSDTPFPNWRASVAGVPIDGQIRFSQMQEKLKTGGYKVTMKLEVPVMETLGASGTAAGYTAPPKVAHVLVTLITQFSDRRATNQNRADALKMALGIAQGASSATATGVLNQASAGNAFVNSTLPITQAFVNCILPN